MTLLNTFATEGSALEKYREIWLLEKRWPRRNCKQSDVQRVLCCLKRYKQRSSFTFCHLYFVKLTNFFSLLCLNCFAVMCKRGAQSWSVREHAAELTPRLESPSLFGAEGLSRHRPAPESRWSTGTESLSENAPGLPLRARPSLPACRFAS